MAVGAAALALEEREAQPFFRRQLDAAREEVVELGRVGIDLGRALEGRDGERDPLEGAGPMVCA